MYFYVSALDRDRAMQKLIDLNADLLTTGQNDSHSSSSHTERMKPRLEKRKKTVNRSLDLFKQADAILNEFSVLQQQQQRPSTSTHEHATATTGSSSSGSASKPALLEIQYDNEVGTGLGPTLEFYALVSLEMQKCAHEMWRGEKVKMASSWVSGAENKDELFFFAPTGLFPAPVSLYIKGSYLRVIQTVIVKSDRNNGILIFC